MTPAPIARLVISHLVIAAGVACACFLAPSAQASAPLPVHRVALVVGANDGGLDRPALRYAQSDADKVATVFQELGQVRPEALIRLDQPSPAAVEVAFDALQLELLRGQQRGAHTEVVIYYSGHSDDKALLLGEQRLPYAKLRKRVEALAADVRVVILDSCSSGAFTRPKGGTHRPAFLVDGDHRAIGFAYLTSSAADEVAQESDRLGGSFFTHALLSGLRGAADLDKNQRVTLHEAYQFAYQQTLAQTERTRFGPQHAAYEMKLRGTGDVVISDLSGADGHLAFASSLDGRLSIRDVRGILVATFDKQPGRAERLAVSSGQYRVSLRNRAGLLTANVAVDVGDVSVTPFDFVSVRLEEATARGPSPLAAAATSEIARVQEAARLREARLRYAANHIAVKEEGNAVKLFVGDSNVQIEGADFYERIGRTDLADQFRANTKAQQAFSLGGMAIELGGVFVAASALAAAAFIGTGPVAGVVFVGMAIGAGILALTGASVASVGLLSDPNPLSSRKSAELARAYNRSLRQELGLRAHDVDREAPLLSPSPPIAPSP